jgi:UDP:flavonoid glycosyltransferase YjiC (YdhE family)
VRNVAIIRSTSDGATKAAATRQRIVQATVDPGELTAPANAHLVTFADHDSLMDRASLVVGHGGHDTTIRAVPHGLPMVGILAMGSDQPMMAKLLDQWHVGIALPRDAALEVIRSAVEAILADPRYQEEAVARSRAFDNLDGAQLAATSIESVLTISSPASTADAS